MSFLKIHNVSIRGISACVPKNISDNSSFYERKWGGYETFVNATGVREHRNSPIDVCSSDLCQAAAEKLLESLRWNKDDVGALVFVSQTPDYYNVPSTSASLQKRLGLSTECYTLDISLGCSGWVYGLSVIASLMQNGSIRKGLLLAGDTPSKFCSPDDKSTFPLFGDAGTVTALEYDETAEPMKFAMFSDGTGADVIRIDAGGYRNPITMNSFEKKDFGDGKVRCDMNLSMDGESVFMFGISKAPKSIRTLCDKFCVDLEKVDCFTFHQANLFMNEKIREKLHLPPEKVPYSMQEFGNTSCASIPLTLVTRRAEELKNEKMKHIACGFGVGLSWGAVYFETANVVVPELTEI